MSTTLSEPEREDARPHDRRLAVWVMAAWTGWALWWCTEPLAMTGRLSHSDEALEWFQEAAAWALLTLVIFRLARRFPLRRGVLLRHLPVHAAATVLASFFATSFAWVYRDWHGDPHRMSYPRLLVHSVPWDTAWYCFVLGIGLAVHFHREARDRQRQAARLALVASRLETRLARAQLDAARMRLQPDLVFTTLDAVAALAPRDPDTADVLTVRLADLLRMVTESFDAADVPLERDAAYLSAWASVRRFHGQGPHVHFDLADDALAATVPAFFLQPLTAALVDGAPSVCVHVRARAASGELRMEVESHGAARLPDADALEDALHRLRHSHGPSSHLHIVSGEGTRAVRVRLPFREGVRHEGANLDEEG